MEEDKPKKEKRMTTTDLIKEIHETICNMGDGKYEQNLLDKDKLAVVKFLEQIHNEIKAKKKEYVIFNDGSNTENAVSLDWIDIIFRRYTE